ncbi:MAG: hypothetical protein ACOX6T_10945 [Myxococcales bacterium]
MQLTVINASPRRAGSNTRRVLEPFLEGFRSVPGANARCFYIHELATGERVRELFLGSEALLLAFPLYCYALPPAAQRFIYELEPLRGRGGARLAFLCQFGFREACHARALERQLAGVCAELGVENLGMVFRGGCEGLSYRPSFATKRLFAGFRALGRSLAERGRWSREELERFAAPETSRAGLLTPVKARIRVAAANYVFWRAQLRRNGALARNWDRPLLDEEEGSDSGERDLRLTSR